LSGAGPGLCTATTPNSTSGRTTTSLFRLPEQSAACGVGCAWVDHNSQGRNTPVMARWRHGPSRRFFARPRVQSGHGSESLRIAAGERADEGTRARRCRFDQAAIDGNPRRPVRDAAAESGSGATDPTCHWILARPDTLDDPAVAAPASVHLLRESSSSTVSTDSCQGRAAGWALTMATRLAGELRKGKATNDARAVAGRSKNNMAGRRWWTTASRRRRRA